MDLNNQIVYNWSVPLLAYHQGALRLVHPLLIPGMIYRLKSKLLTGPKNAVLRSDAENIFPAFWTPHGLFFSSFDTFEIYVNSESFQTLPIHIYLKHQPRGLPHAWTHADEIVRNGSPKKWIRSINDLSQYPLQNINEDILWVITIPAGVAITIYEEFIPRGAKNI